MRNLTIFICVLMLTQIGCEEKNPYATDRVIANPSVGSEDTSSTSANNKSEPSEDQDNVVQDEDLSEEAKTVTEVLCDSGASFPEAEGAFSIGCNNGQPTVALVQALENPYAGQGDASVNLVQSDDVNGISQFKVITALKLPKTPAEIQAFSNQLNESDFTEGNATIVQTELSSVAGTAPVLQTAVIQFDLTVQVSIITVNDTRILEQQYVMLDETSNIVGIKSYLKAGEPDNDDNIIASQISFIVPSADGASSTMVSMSQQHADNRGQHETAEQTFTNLALRTMINAYGLMTTQ